MTAPVLKVDRLRVVVAGRRSHGAVMLLDGVSFSLLPGEVLGLSGPSGCGKSTLLRALARLLEPAEGNVWLNGRHWDELDVLEYRKQVCYLPQVPVALAGTVEDNLRYVFGLHRELKVPGVPGELLDRVHLPRRLLGQAATTLSVGEKQRLALARALALQPGVLLLDEPASALDSPNAQHILDLLAEVCSGGKFSALITSHAVEHLRIAHRRLFLEEGSVVSRE